ncbi:SH3 and PX-domain-containing 3 [Mycena sanguinolenta]|uniref:SH3 and PX-domain-containing 3 n=1 Tax=Mycena sanguinolenta TaxID=230812 RepID=A0A8H6YWX2_9AGAR|nr:SH3 and PX-domain-containing 3 [Mycena sanguinolenta]
MQGHSPRRISKRQLIGAVAGTVVLFSFAWSSISAPTESHSVLDALARPTFNEIRTYERNLPQSPRFTSNGTDLPRYLFFPKALWGSGWNNVFQEQLLNSHLAYLSQRAYVFPPFTPQDHPPFPDTLPDGKRSLLEIPMNALVSGPTGGGPLSDDGSDSIMRRAIPQESWDIVCPWWKTVDVTVDDIMREMRLDGTSDAVDVMGKFAEKLLKMSAPCVRIQGGSVFDQLFIGSSRILSLWPSYGHSPILQNFAWSPLVTAAMFWNFHLLSNDKPPKYLLPRGRRPHKFESFPPLHNSEPPIAGLLGIHVRRGDFEGHCVNLVNGGADYNAWSALGTPGLPNRPSHPASFDSVWVALPNYLDIPAGQSRRDAAYDHCWPAPEAIVARANEVRDSAEGRGLGRIYISTNGDPSWVTDLARLLAIDGWEVSSSLDMELTLEETAVSQAVDMGILTAAQVFIGMGFSSLTSNVVQIRLAGGRRPDTIYFW